MKILISDSINTAGVDILRQFADVDMRPNLKPDELRSIINNYDALVVRSQTKVTADIIGAADKLQVIGRAGVGVASAGRAG